MVRATSQPRHRCGERASARLSSSRAWRRDRPS